MPVTSPETKPTPESETSGRVSGVPSYLRLALSAVIVSFFWIISLISSIKSRESSFVFVYKIYELIYIFKLLQNRTSKFFSITELFFISSLKKCNFCSYFTLI